MLTCTRNAPTPQAGAKIMMKDASSGQLSPLALLALFPFLFVMLGFWRIRHAIIDCQRKENPYDKVWMRVYGQVHVQAYFLI
jgi:hypothetical protein